MRNRFYVVTMCLLTISVIFSCSTQCVPSLQAASASESATKTGSTTKTISPKILEKYSLITVKVKEDGNDKEFKGVPLRVLLGEMVPRSLGSMPDWKNLAKKELVMEVIGDDGYPGLVTAAEVASNESGDRFILATQENGKPIETGVRMICKLDQFHLRWVRGIVSLRIASVEK